ncbi:PIN domain-like protein [Ophiobolus disseminans]|uniref:PIN domain-like protein n=1 Tax=Ophiobolus disseminans TaxID=1469910 RepID=A0A6A6ZXL8_9PLEO|nr:PIN domain-like protein [Ophiobolus disseminans]
MICDFERWNATIGELGNIQELNGCRVGIEAADYLTKRILNHPRAKEPLVPALGGLPLAWRQTIGADLHAFTREHIEVRFVFSGLDITEKDDPFQQKLDEAAVNANAWNLYDSHQAEASVAKFGESKYVTAEDLFPALQSILTQRGLPFTVAPYSAWAQLAYLERTNYCQAVSGSSEILLFECDRIITAWDFEERQFYWTQRSKCMTDLERVANSGAVTEDIFVDACMLAGTPFLPTLPNLNSPNRADLPKPHGAIKMIMSNGLKTGHSVIGNNLDDPRFKQTDYLEKYRRARSTVRNHPVYTVDGRIEPLNTSTMPNDAVNYLQSRLPDEVYHYLSAGLINPRILQWRTTCKIFDVPPIDGGESPEYRSLVGSKLTPMRTTTISLLSSSLHNWYRHKNLQQKCWFSDPAAEPQEVRIADATEILKLVETWNVKDEVSALPRKKHPIRNAGSDQISSGYLGSAVLTLTDVQFNADSVTKRDSASPLSTMDEILYNSLWRFLTLLGYADAEHKLTPWGRILAAAMDGAKDRPDLEEGVFIAVELLRLGILNGDINMFPTYNGAPMRGSREYMRTIPKKLTNKFIAKDQQFNMLFSRVAGVGELRHKPIGFTGPLSQHLLGYNSIINMVRQSLRDLVETTVTNMFLTGCCDRLALDLSEVAMKLPFLLPNNCALSIATKSYLDELLSNDAPDPTNEAHKSQVLKTASERYFPQSVNFAGDLTKAMELWKAVFEGVKIADKQTPMPDATVALWKETNEWLAGRL